ncbi:MAG TPA: WYL domain-containing protein, partial [Acidimicrobiales bacterium]|nr:WYL domain-containing protein [Acidimicrobiales bacterium]
MRADRLLALLLLLQANGRTTAAALAQELEVSVRTIYRDIQALAAAGVPVYAESGPGGGCRLLAGYRSPLDALSPEEADALLILGVPAPVRQLGLASPAESAHRRVTQATNRRRRADPSTAGLVHLDLPRWFHPSEKTPLLVPLARAVRQCRRVQLSYNTNHGTRPKRRDVEPLGLVNKAGIWYLVAATQRGNVVFRVGRIRSADISDEAFRRPPAFDLEQFWAAWSEEFVSSRPRMPVTVRASPKAIELFPEILGEAVRPALQRAGPPDARGWQQIEL